MINIAKKYFIYSIIAVFLFSNISIAKAEEINNNDSQYDINEINNEINTDPSILDPNLINEFEINYDINEQYLEELFIEESPIEESPEIQPYVLPAVPVVVALIGSAGLRVAVKTYGKSVIKQYIKEQEKVARAAAKDLGYTEVNNQYSHGAAIYMRNSGSGPKYISRDKDDHSGGVWKGATSIKNLGKRETRSGTYDIFLERMGD